MKYRVITKISLISLFVFVMMLSFNLTPKAYGWGFSKNNNHLTPEIGKYQSIIEGTDSYYVGNENSKEIYLTFDAGYDNGNLSGILDILKEKNVKCTFFVTGDFLEREQELLLRIVDEGHIVGNHTYNHKNITKINSETLKEEINKIEEKYYQLTSQKMIKFFRPPEGQFDRDSLLRVKNMGYKTFFWSIAYDDWDTRRQHGGDYGYKKIMNHVHNGAIILLHTVSKDNLECLPKVIDDLRNNGYEIKNLDQI